MASETTTAPNRVRDNRLSAWWHAFRRWCRWTRAETAREAALEARLARQTAEADRTLAAAKEALEGQIAALEDAAAEAAALAADELERVRADLRDANLQVQQLQSQNKIMAGEIKDLGLWVTMLREQCTADLAMHAARAARNLAHKDLLQQGDG
jgi:hypothetical protein